LSFREYCLVSKRFLLAHCIHPFNQVSARCRSGEGIGEVLGFACDLVTPEFHDAHGIGWLAVICQDEFSNPKIAAAHDPLHRKPLLAGLTGALILNVASAASTLARLRIVEHRVLVI